jgi:hypothetical protein
VSIAQDEGTETHASDTKLKNSNFTTALLRERSEKSECKQFESFPFQLVVVIGRRIATERQLCGRGHLGTVSFPS